MPYSAGDSGHVAEHNRLGLTACRVYRSAAQTMTAATITPVSFDAESYDTSAMHDLVTDPTRVTVPTAGKYLVIGCITYGVTSGQIQCCLYKNGSLHSIQVETATSTDPEVQCNDVIDMATGDYIELVARQATGSTGLGVGSAQVYLSVVKLG